MDRLTELVQSHPDQIVAITALCALFLSFLSIFLTWRTLVMQREHNFRSLTPILNIVTGNYEDLIEVKLRNTGVGPLIVKSFAASAGGEHKNNVIFWMPALPPGIWWSTFIEEIEGRCIPPNQDMVILQLKVNLNDPAHIKFRDNVRQVLKPLGITVEYNDIYDRRMPIARRELRKPFGADTAL